MRKRKRKGMAEQEGEGEREEDGRRERERDAQKQRERERESEMPLPPLTPPHTYASSSCNMALARTRRVGCATVPTLLHAGAFFNGGVLHNGSL